MNKDFQIIDFNDNSLNRQMESIFHAVDEGIDEYMAGIGERIHLLQIMYRSINSFFCDTLKELGIVPIDSYTYIREALSMDDYQFEAMTNRENTFGLPILTFVDKNRSSYTIYATIEIADDEREEDTTNISTRYSITRIGRNQKECYLNSDHVWCEMNGESDGEVVNLFETTELQKKILTHDTLESTLLKVVLEKYGSITDEKYIEIRKKYATILESDVPADGYFELAHDGEIVLRSSLKMGFCIKENNGKWNIYQYLTHKDMDFMGFQAGQNNYKKLIGTTTNSTKALRLFDEENSVIELIIPVSANNAIAIPESMLMSDIKSIIMGKYVKKLNSEEKKKLDDFCNWFDQFSPFDVDSDPYN